MRRKNILIMGAAGRDFHNFNVVFRDNPEYKVVAFTATQIPNIDGRIYPAALAGKLYPKGIPILPEDDLVNIIRKDKVDYVIFSYSDVTHQYVMEKASLCMANGAEFAFLSGKKTMIKSRVPVIAITAVRTGVGKSQTSRYITEILKKLGKKTVAIRHPMPYGDLVKQAVQRFSTLEDMDKHQCTIEEREEYEPYIENGFVVYAGVDYGAILKKAQREAEVILWDGGNNDLPFYQPDLHICLVDPHRPGHELSYYPGHANFLMADLLLINKVSTADPDSVKTVLANCKRYNPSAKIMTARSPFAVSDLDAIRDKKVVVVEDGPTLTHGEMAYGAGYLAAKEAGAKSVISPVPYAVRSIAATYKKYPHCKGILPAMGYGAGQIRDLEKTINKIPADAVVIGTPIDLRRMLNINKPAVRVQYNLEEVKKGKLRTMIRKIIES